MKEFLREPKSEQKMGIRIDTELEKVLEFMTLHVPADKLMPVATSMAALAPVLWGKQTGRGFVSFRPESLHEQLSVATQSPPVRVCERGDFEGALDSQSRM